jgi:phosphoribosylaminoimidazole (AIR) synthetase
MGIGFVICVAETNEGIAREILTKEGQPVFRIGQIVSGNKPEVCWK